MENTFETLCETPLAQEHVKLGARMVPFAGWNMPVQYPAGILAEHKQCRTRAALFDICHMGEFRVKGERAAADLDALFPRPVTDQPCLVCRYNFSLNEKGGVQDDLIVYRIAQDEFYIVVNAGPRLSDAAWIRAHLSEGVTLTDESDDTAKLDLQGPAAADVLERLGLKRSELPGYYKFMFTEIKGIPVLLSRTGYTGELGFELYFDAAKAVEMWNLLLNDPAVEPAGLGARDTLRLEMGYPLYGHEMDETTTPIEAGFGGMLKLDMPRTFVASEIIQNPELNRPKRRLLGFKLEGKRAARAGAAILLDGKVIGTVTSGAFGPSVDYCVAMGYVDADLTLPEGTVVALDAGKTQLPATVTPTPFYTKGTARVKLF